MSDQGDRRSLTIGLMLAVAAIAFESYAVLTAMPAAAQDLGDLDLYAWTFTAFVIAMTFSIVASGQVTDRIGPVQPMIIGFVVFALGLAIAGGAPTMLVLLAARFVQGLGAGTMNVAVMVLIARVFDERERATLMTWFSACWMVPAFIGPTVAATIAETTSWHWVFWSVLPLMAVAGALVIGPLRRVTLSIEEPHQIKKRLLWLAALVAAGTAALQWAGQTLDLASALWGIAGVAAIAVGLPPLMPKGFTWIPHRISGVIGARLFSAGAFFGAQAFLTLALIQSRGISLITAGIILAVGALGWMAGALMQSQSWLHLSRDQLIQLGVAAIAAGIALLSIAAFLPWLWIGVLLLGWILAGFGMGIQNASTSLAIMQMSSEAELGRNTSALQVGESLGSSLFTGVAGAWFTWWRVRSSDEVTFGGLFAVMAVVGLLAIWSARHIGTVQNHSLKGAAGDADE